MTKISKSEMELMRIIWNAKTPVTNAELLQLLPTENDWKATTVLTFLSRLVGKGMVTVEKQGKANLYSATASEAAYRAQETVHFLESVHKGSLKSLMVALGDSDGLTQAELDELRSWLAGR